VQLQQICNDLKSQVSSLSQEVEKERSQRITLSQKYSNEVMQLKAQMEDKLSQLKASHKLEAKPLSNEFESLPMPQELICNKIHEFKFMEEQENTSTIASASKPFAGDISTMPVSKTLRSTNEVLQQANTQFHTVAGLSYDTVNFPLLDKVATKYKSFEVPKQNGTTRSLRIPVT
jgi:phage host-nuclease inhibitor protein Gam